MWDGTDFTEKKEKKRKSAIAEHSFEGEKRHKCEMEHKVYRWKKREKRENQQ